MAETQHTPMEALKDAHMAMDDIFMTIAYVNTHGVSAEPYPPPEGGGPQIVAITPDEFGRLFQRIGTLAKEAMQKIETVPGFTLPTLDDFSARSARERAALSKATNPARREP